RTESARIHVDPFRRQRKIGADFLPEVIIFEARRRPPRHPAGNFRTNGGGYRRAGDCANKAAAARGHSLVCPHPTQRGPDSILREVRPGPAVESFNVLRFAGYSELYEGGGRDEKKQNDGGGGRIAHLIVLDAL